MNTERGQVIALTDEPGRAQKALLASSSRVNHHRLTSADWPHQLRESKHRLNICTNSTLPTHLLAILIMLSSLYSSTRQSEQRHVLLCSTPCAHCPHI